MELIFDIPKNSKTPKNAPFLDLIFSVSKI